MRSLDSECGDCRGPDAITQRKRPAGEPAGLVLSGLRLDQVLPGSLQPPAMPLAKAQPVAPVGSILGVTLYSTM